MNEIKLDCCHIETKADFHAALAGALSLPNTYEKSLDALYDALAEIPQGTRLILSDWHHLEYRLGDYSGKAVYVFHCATRENPHLSILLEP